LVPLINASVLDLNNASQIAEKDEKNKPPQINFGNKTPQITKCQNKSINKEIQKKSKQNKFSKSKEKNLIS
jgi:hypothetical protein